MIPYLLVLLLSIGAGVTVYALSMRGARTDANAAGFGPDPSSPEDPLGAPPGYTYLQVSITRGPSLGQRLQGLVGSIALVVLGALAVAGMLYSLGVLIARTIERFLGE